MASVDDRIVRMEFDNSAFERKVQQTLTSLGQLDKALKLTGAKQGLADVSAEANKFDMSHMGEGIENISKKFLALSTIALTALSNITNKAIDAGIQIVKSLSLDQITAGFQEYELKLGSIQTIMAGSGASLETVNQKLKELNEYSDRTIYSFADMTTNIGKFTNAGVSLDQSVASIQGVANVAAVSGANAEEASRAMYNFAQALSKGHVQLIDWKSIELANMGTVEFKQQLIDAAEATGELTKQGDKWVTKAGNAVSATQGFNESLTDQWLTTEVLTNTLGDYADETTDIGKKAFAAAQDVKTFTQLMSTVKESIGSGWAETFEILIGNFDEAKSLFSDINNAIGTFVGKNADARNELLGTWKMMGGRALLIDSMKEALQNLGEILKPIKDAFRDIFPPVTGQQLMELTQLFQRFARALQPTADTVDNLRSIFRGLFSILEIGWTIIKEGVKFIANLVGAVGVGSGSFLEFAAKIGDFFTNLNSFLVEGKGIQKFFEKLGDVISAPLAVIGLLKDAVLDFFTSLDPSVPDGVADSFGRLGDRWASVKDAFSHAADIWEPFSNALSKIVTVLDRIWEVIKTWFQELGQKIADTMGEGDFDKVLDAVNVGLLGGIAALLAKFIKSGFTFDIGGGMFDKIGQTFEQLTGVLKSMQTKIKAEALMKIAIAIGILTASVLVLSMIDSAALTKALTAMAVGFGQLMASFSVLAKMASGPASAAKFAVMAFGLNLLATSIFILALAAKQLADLGWEELAKGLLGVTALLLILTVMATPLAANAAQMALAGVGILAIATGLLILGAAMKIFASMSWDEMKTGLVGVTAALIAIGLAVRLIPKSIVITGAGLILLATGLTILAGAIKLFAMMSLADLAKGIIGVSAALALIGLAMQLMPISLPITAAGLVLVGIALGAIAGAMKLFGGMSWAEIARGLVAMAGALLILAAATYAMQGSVLGAIAIGVVALSLGVLFKVIEAFAGLSWGDLFHGLAGLAIALTVLGLAAWALTPVVPTLLALGIALMALGAGFALVGVGAMLVGKALEVIAKSGKAAAEALPAILKAIGAAIPALLEGLAQGIVDTIKVFTDAAPVIAEALGAVLEHLMDTVVKLIPKFITVFDKLTTALLDFLNEKGPDFIETGLMLLVKLLEGISENIDHITDLVSEIIIKFLDSLAEHVDEIVQAGMTLLATFLNGIAENIHLITEAMGNIITSFIAAVATYYTQILQAGVDLIVKFIEGITSAIWQIVSVGAEMIIQLIVGIGQKSLEIIAAAAWVIEQFIIGIGNTIQRLIDVGVWVILQVLAGLTEAVTLIVPAAVTLIVTFIDEIAKNVNRIITAGKNLVLAVIRGIAENLNEFADAAFDVVTEFIKQLRITIDSKGGELREQGKLLAGAIINGMTGGLAAKAKEAADGVVDVAKGAVDAGKRFLGINSPSKVFIEIGKSMAEGLVYALDSDTTVAASSTDFISRTADIFKDSLNKITEDLGAVEEFNPVITPVLDLTQLATDASKISDYIQSSEAINAATSYANARTIAAGTATRDTEATSPNAPNEIKFEQTINAPTQLSTSDIYKQTRNQLTLAKEELSIP
jgi:tape measure domain-containing protein